jgi:hypothetical protein
VIGLLNRDICKPDWTAFIFHVWHQINARVHNMLLIKNDVRASMEICKGLKIQCKIGYWGISCLY